MATIRPTTRAMLWALEANSTIAYTGVTNVGELTGTAPEYVTHYADNEDDFLTAVAGKAGDYNPLPDSGRVQAGEVYGYERGLVIVRQTHSRTERKPEDEPDLFHARQIDSGGR